MIDGASTDGTLELIRAEEDESMVVLSEPDEGSYEALNKGIKLSRGGIIGLLHSDDEFAIRDVLSSVARAFSGSDVAVVFGDIIVFRSPEVCGKGVFSAGEPAVGGCMDVPGHQEKCSATNIYRGCAISLSAAWHSDIWRHPELFPRSRFISR